MAKTVIEELGSFGQSIWVDDISRQMIEDGSLKKMIDIGLRGMTSNPTIFEKAIDGSSIYNKQIEELCAQSDDAFHIYDELTVRDIQGAADMFLPVYKKTDRFDGYVSLEVSPRLSHQTEDTIKEVKRLHKKVNRPNVMFKIPSTKEGFKAIEECLASGINVNITLIFSLQQYIDTANAYLRGIKRLIQSKGNPQKVHSVASVFVSRMDTAVDKLLDEKNNLSDLKGRAAVSNATMIYREHLKMFSSEEFDAIKKEKASIQRVLWASTSTKNPAYSDIKYVTELIARNTVNTVPIKTFNAFLDHGKCIEALTKNRFGAAELYLQELKEFGIDIDVVCAKLLKDGVDAFTKSFESLLSTIKEKTATLCRK